MSDCPSSAAPSGELGEQGAQAPSRPFNMPSGYWQHYGISPAIGVRPRLLRKEIDPGEVRPGAEDAVAHASGSSGTPLPNTLLRKFETSLGADLGAVRVHTGSASAEAAAAVNARAYTTGQDIHFGQGQYDPSSAAGSLLLAHEVAHTVQQAGAAPARQHKLEVGSPADPAEAVADAAAESMVRGLPASLDGLGTGVQRKEVQKDGDIQGTQDWTQADREGNTPRWQAACLRNLNAVDTTQYVKVVERRDFYKWFYEYTASLGYTTRWALAARLVADGAHQIADMDQEHAFANDSLGMANVELQGVMREGNQVIFDNVLPKLKRLLDGGPLKGPAALKWDMQILAEEQALVQPLYNKMSPDTINQLDYIARKKRFAGVGAWWSDGDKVPQGPYNNAGKVPGFDQPDLKNVGDRWKYGMGLGNQFTPGGSGFDPSQNAMPTPGIGYTDGSELAKVDNRANLHQLDAWLNPNRYTRVQGTPGADIQATISRMSPFEKMQVLQDQSPDGWAYSIQFAQFSIDESVVRSALPADPAQAGAVAAFMTRYKTERDRVNAQYNPYIMMPMP